MDALEQHGDAPHLWDRLGADALSVLAVVGRSVPGAYLVGGVVRDLLLGQPSRDLDVVLEARVAGTRMSEFAPTLQQQLGGTLSCHETFLTCTLALPVEHGGQTLDLATARSEYYPHPGALPVVTPSDLARDLGRRDFSVNTFALGVAAPHPLLSVKGAQEDLEAGRLRSLHEQSFADDPTRAVRGARLAGRLGFAYDAPTADSLQRMLDAEHYRTVSPERFKNELLLTLAEPTAAPALTVLAASGVLSACYGLTDTPLIAGLDSFRTKFAERVAPESYVLALLTALPETAAAAHVRRFSWPQRLLRARNRLLQGEPPRSDSERAVARVLQPSLMSAGYAQVQGRDVLSLGLSAGPEVGAVLKAVAKARTDGRVASFAAELELAQRLVQDILTREKA